MLRKKYAAYAFAIMIAAPSMGYAQIPESATDATTPIDKQVGNQFAPRDNTLSNQEVEQLQQEGAGGQQQTTGAMGTVTGSSTVSGTTAIYKEKSGSAAKTEGNE